MQCVVVYDITDDKKRAKIADACLDYGMDRIQYSAFMGELLPNHQDELMLKLTSLLGKSVGNIQMFPVCEKDWAARRVVEQKGEPPDKKEAEDAVECAQ